MKVAMCQINTTVGDFDGNVNRILEMAKDAEASGAEIAVFPELAVCGYPPRDFLDRPTFVAAAMEAAKKVVEFSGACAIAFGHLAYNEIGTGRALFNAATVAHKGVAISVHYKTLLPTYDVFDEDRHFEPSSECKCAKVNDDLIAVTICEDVWPSVMKGRYDRNPVKEMASEKPLCMINLSASPFSLGRTKERFELLQEHARTLNAPVVYVNAVGGNDDIVFDGGSFALDANGDVIASAALCREDMIIADLSQSGGGALVVDELETLQSVLVLGIRDYCHKTNFKSVVLGLSGGIDSAIVATLAADALGAKNVHCVAMPSMYSSEHSLSDAKALADAIGVNYEVIPIEPMYRSFEGALSDLFKGTTPNEAEENLQSRIRGVLLMGISNKFGHLVLATGNKSEAAVGYCTLYGDTNGALAPIVDLPKTLVYELARYINRDGVRIPISTIEKPPSAELRPDQFDEDTLPPYEILDGIVRLYIEENKGVNEIVEAGYEEQTVRFIVNKIVSNEYKRYQLPPGIRVSSKAFGSGRRVPIVARWRD